MNTRNLLLSSLIILGAIAPVKSALAQTMDVDQADTIDFQSFHKDKKEAIKVWDKNSTGPTKAYQEQSADNSAGKTPATATVETTPSKSLTGVIAGNPSKRFEIRERYTLTRSTKTPYSAFYVIEPLYNQAAQLCAKGWKKLAEKSEPVEQDFYLYYEIECL